MKPRDYGPWTIVYYIDYDLGPQIVYQAKGHLSRHKLDKHLAADLFWAHTEHGKVIA